MVVRLFQIILEMSTTIKVVHTTETSESSESDMMTLAYIPPSSDLSRSSLIHHETLAKLSKRSPNPNTPAQRFAMRLKTIGRKTLRISTAKPRVNSTKKRGLSSSSFYCKDGCNYAPSIVTTREQRRAYSKDHLSRELEYAMYVIKWSRGEP